MYGEKAWRQLHKNAKSCIQKVLEATPHKTATYHPSRKPSKLDEPDMLDAAGELITDVLLWTPLHRRAKVGRPARMNLQQPYADTRCSLEELLGEMDDRDDWWERVREIHVLRSHIHDYGHVRNRHVMFINDRTYKEQESQKHVTTSCSGTKPFY